jgi:hypothetical protein
VGITGAKRGRDTNKDVDWHGHPIGDRNQAAMGQLWDEWRNEKLDVWNGYRDI